MSPTRRLVAYALATLALTTVHHVYGGIVYATPWRVHGAAVAVVLALLVVKLSRRASPALLIVVVVVTCVLAIGVFEGLYNHVLKNALYFGGAQHALLLRLFPPPTYELPDDVLFELTGCAQALSAGFVAAACVAVVRAMHAASGRQLVAGSVVPLRQVVAINGEPLAVPDPRGLTHLQFRRFAGCPICNLHLRSFARRHGELVDAGIREVVAFHSSDAELRAHAGELPFAVLADPEKRLYTEFGVETGARSLLDPRVWPTIVVAVGRTVIAMARGRERSPSLVPSGGRWGLPADFLIEREGRVLASHYGRHADDQWTVDEVLAKARHRE